MQKACAYIERWLGDYHRRHTIPGFSVGIAQAGRTLLRRSWGYANIEKKEKLTPAHAFRIASHSKIFTAVALLQLAEAKKLKLDDPVSLHLSWLKNNRRAGKVTLRNLLSHGGGLRREPREGDFWLLTKEFPNASAIREEIDKAGYVLKQGKEFKYSNLAFALLGQVIETLSGKPYAAYVRDHIARPLRLRHTAAEWSPAFPGLIASGYGRRQKEGQRNALDTKILTHAFAPAGGVVSVIDDLLRLGSALAGDDDVLLSARSKTQQHRIRWKVPHRANRWYGLGLLSCRIGKERLWGHSGSLPGHQTQTLWHRESRTVVTVMMNAIDAPVSTLCDAIFALLLYFGKNGKSKSRRGLQRYEGRYENIWETLDLEALGNTLHRFLPETDDPAASAIALIPAGNDRFRLEGVSGFDSPHEFIQFPPSATKKPAFLKYAACTMNRKPRQA